MAKKQYEKLRLCHQEADQFIICIVELVGPLMCTSVVQILLLVAMPGAPSSFLFLVAMHLLLIAMP